MHVLPLSDPRALERNRLAGRDNYAGFDIGQNLFGGMKKDGPTHRQEVPCRDLSFDS
jgi:hypothetical protein